MRPISRIGPAQSSDSESDAEGTPKGKSPPGAAKKQNSLPGSARSTSSSSPSSSPDTTPRKDENEQKTKDENKRTELEKDESSEQDSEIEKSMAVVRATVETVHGARNSEDDDVEPSQSLPVQVETTAEVYPEPKEEELETTKESYSTNHSGDSNERAVKQEMQKVLENTTEVAVSTTSDSESSSGSSDSSSSESSESEPEQKPKTKQAHKSHVSATDTGGFDSSDVHGGHDPDRVAAGEGTAAHLSTFGVTPVAKHDGSIKPLLESQTNVELTSIALSPNQVDELCDHLACSEDVESLVLRNTAGTDESIARISKSLKQSITDLKMLNLNLNNITDSGICNVVDIVRSKSNLEILLLHGNPLGDAGVERLVTGLEEIHRSGQIAEEHTPAIRKAAKDVAADVLKDALQSTSLRSVVTQGSNGSNGIAAPTADVESRNTQESGLKLQQLDIGDCHVTDLGAKYIAKLIKLNAPITTLVLSGNKGVTSDGWRHIADALKYNTVITTLSLDYNSLGDDGAKLFSEALRENKTLLSVDLEGNKIGQSGAQNLLSALRQNESIRDITLMPGNRIDDQVLQDIKNAINGAT